jgi:hypothetical protein
VQRRRAAGHGHRVPDASALGERLLEAGNQRALGDPVRREGVAVTSSGSMV